MIKSFLTNWVLLLSLASVFTLCKVNAQQTVFTEDFNSPGESRFTYVRSGPDFGASIDAFGKLVLTNDATSAANVKGWVLASALTSNFLSPYNSILSKNPGIVSWNFNMRQLRGNPAGLTDGKYGVAYILAGSDGSSGSTGKGYAIMLGQSGITDPIRLVTYNNGVQSYSTKLSSSSSGLSDFGKEYASIRVEYNPANNEWSLYVRKDNTNSFNDPKTGTLVYQGKVANAEFINEPLQITGAYWNANTAAKQTAFFDNISVSVEVPKIISINPDSKIANSGAFTLTVEGEGFTPASKVDWNGVQKVTNFVSAAKLTAAILSTDITLPTTLPVTVRNGTFISNAVNFEIEPSGVPSLTLSKNILPIISTVVGTASAATEIYTITGSDLQGAATVTAPANFEISRDGTTYFNSLTLESSGGPLSGGTITLRARLKSNAPAGNYTGNITHTSAGAATKSVAVSGRVLAVEPTSNASGTSFTNITSTGFRLNWNNTGNGEQRLVLVKEATPVNALPLDATTYSANSSFANGSEIGTGNYVVLKSDLNSVQISGLKPNTVYHISIIEFNGLPGIENYRTSGAIGSAQTLNSPLGLQIKEADTSYKINFDDTVDGVNLETFQGAGIAKIAEAGQLDSDSWAFTGFASGNIAFGGESLEDSSYENGTSEGAEIDTGIYAFNVGTTQDENFTLGIQPGGTDFNSGSIALRIQNQTNSVITSVNIGYKVYVYNDQIASSRIRFSSSSSAGGPFTDQAIVDVISPETADLAPGWKAYYRSVTISTGNIAKSGYYYIRWNGSLITGSGAQDEFAIDDIEVIANATSNFAEFGGIAEDFVLQGNANLGANLSVQNKLLFNGGKLAIKDKTLTIASSVVNTSSEGLTGGSSSKIIIRGTRNPFLSFDQTTIGTTNALQSLNLLGTSANKVSLLNSLKVDQLLKTDGLQILDLGTHILSGSLSDIQNNGKILTQSTSITPFPAGKIWGGTGILNLNAATAVQTLVGGTYSNLTLSSTGGTTAAANIIINGMLDLPAANASKTRGSLSMENFVLTMGDNGTNSGIGDVTGIITRTSLSLNKLYTFGHPNTSISFSPSGTLPASMSIKLNIGAKVGWRNSPVLRSVDIIQTGAENTKAVIRQHYLDSELTYDAVSNKESNLVFWGKLSNLNVFEQGRSSNNTTDNWVEITNANLGLYFQSTFGQVELTLDESEAPVLTWNGSVSNSWTTSANWTPTGTPSFETKVIIPNVASLPNQPIINPTGQLGAIIIETGGILNSPANSELTMFGGAGAWQNNGTFNPGSGNIIFNNIDATISGSTTFSNLTIAAGKGLRALEGNYMSIAGALVNNGTMFTTLTPNTIEFTGNNQTIPAPGGEAFGGYHHLKISGSGNVIFQPNTNIRGDVELNQMVNFAGKTINLAGISNQIIKGNAAINFSDLIVNKASGAVVLAQDITVGNTLTLASGNVVIGSKNLTLGGNPVAGTFDVSHMIVADGSGLVRHPFNSFGSYFFPIGEMTSNPAYSPISVSITSGSFLNAFVGVSVVDAIHPNNYSSQNYISRYWNVLQTGITGAVASITANYVSAEVLVPETTLAAGQLNGPFNILTNPWKKVGTLANNTLSAAGVILTTDQKSIFTGIKGGAFSVEVYGYGEFCVGSTTTLDAVTQGGDAPFTYIWSNGLPDSATVSIPTTTTETTNYTLTVRDANGFTASDIDIPVKILPASAGGTISNNMQQICAGTLPGDLQLNGSVGSVLYWQKSTAPDFTTFENLSNFTTSLSGSEIGPLTETTYFRAVVQNGTCNESTSNVGTITVKSTIWNGTEWSAEIPNSLTSAIFAANYTISAGEITSCNCQVNQGVILTVEAGSTFTIQNDIVNNGTIIIESDGNLIQISNDGLYKENAVGLPLPLFSVRRKANIKRLDYVYWSSPVTDQKLKSFSPGTLNNRFLTYNEWNDEFVAVPSVNADFDAGKGYAIRAGNTQPAAATDWIGTFTGIPNNGEVRFALQYKSGSNQAGNGYNLIGNPYPSNINFDNLLDDTLNPGNSDLMYTLAYFWTNTNPNGAMQGSGYPKDGLINNYAIYNGIGGLPATAPATNATPDQPIPTVSSPTPNGIIKIGQAFIVKAKQTGDLKFRNNIKVSGAGAFFDRSIPTDRFWLNLTTPLNVQTSTLIGYKALATNDFDLDYDAPLLILGADAFYSSLDDRRLAIQGRSSFVNTDLISLGTNHYEAGIYTISLGNKEGVFANGQNIYLKDNQTGVVTDLAGEAYEFSANKGLSEGRFEISYLPETVLVTDSTIKDELVVYRDSNDFVLKSSGKKIDAVEVYDTGGRLIYNVQPHQTRVIISVDRMVNGVYILKINQGGKIRSKKIRK